MNHFGSMSAFNVGLSTFLPSNYALPVNLKVLMFCGFSVNVQCSGEVLEFSFSTVCGQIIKSKKYIS